MRLQKVAGRLHAPAPGAPAGTVVRGTLELDTFDPLTSMGDQVVAIPYAYTVG